MLDVLSEQYAVTNLPFAYFWTIYFEIKFFYNFFPAFQEYFFGSIPN